MFPNIWSEITSGDLEILESIMVSDVGHRSVLGRTPTRQLNPYGKYFQNTPPNWSSTAYNALYNSNSSLKVVGVNYLMAVGDGNERVLVGRKFNQSAGDVKDIFNKVYGYSFNAPGINFINQAYLDFKVGEPLPTVYLETLLKNVKLCPLLGEHRLEFCSKFHEKYNDYSPW